MRIYPGQLLLITPRVNWDGKEKAKHVKRILYKNSCKFPPCIIFPDKFTPWKLPFAWFIPLWKNPWQKIPPSPENVWMHPNKKHYVLITGIFYNLNIFPLGLWEGRVSCCTQRHCYWVSQLWWTKCLSQKFDRTILERKWRGGGLVAVQFFRSLKKGTRNFNFRLNEPSFHILGPLGGYDHP